MQQEEASRRTHPGNRSLLDNLGTLWLRLLSRNYLSHRSMQTDSGMVERPDRKLMFKLRLHPRNPATPPPMPSLSSLISLVDLGRRTLRVGTTGQTIRSRGTMWRTMMMMKKTTGWRMEGGRGRVGRPRQGGMAAAAEEAGEGGEEWSSMSDRPLRTEAEAACADPPEPNRPDTILTMMKRRTVVGLNETSGLVRLSIINYPQRIFRPRFGRRNWWTLFRRRVGRMELPEPEEGWVWVWAEREGEEGEG